MKVIDIYNFLNELYPVNTAADFDNVGLLVGSGETEVQKVLISLDCTADTLITAKENGCELIITHHPVIFEPLKNVLTDSLIFKLIESGISVISMHTNLDIAEAGVSYQLAKQIGLDEISSFSASNGFILKSGIIPDLAPENFAERIKAALNANVRYVIGKKNIKRVLVCSGSGGDYYKDAIENGFDALVTSEVKHHQFLAAFDSGLSLYDAGHFATEDVIVEPLKDILSEHFTDCKFLTNHKNNIKTV